MCVTQIQYNCIAKQVEGSDFSVITQLIENAEPEIRNQFIDIISNIRESMDLNQIEELIQSGDINELFRQLDNTIAPLANIVIGTIVTSGNSIADFINRAVPVNVSFDQTNFRAVNVMRESRLEFIRQFTQEQRLATQQALVNGIQQGLNPRDQARVFRDSIGLTTRQLTAVQNFRNALEANSAAALSRELRDRRFDRTIRNAINSGTPLSTQQIGRMVDRYRDRYLIFRSETIARTEALRAVHEGAELMYEQAIEEGALAPDALERTWVTAGDGRVRDTHGPLNNTTQNFGEAFITPAGNRLRYPGDGQAPASETVKCRCVLTTRFRDE